MRKLHLKFYLAIVGTLMLFLAAGGMIWHHLSSPTAAMSGIESASGLAVAMLNESATADDQQRILDTLARHLRADVAQYDARGVVLRMSGRPVPLLAEHLAAWGWHFAEGGPTLTYFLANDGRLVVHPRHRFFLHGLHMGLLLTSIAIALALLIYPITRGITARLGRLQDGVLRFGGGDLAVRVKVEGRDEVATLARSFNESAERIELLVRAHQMLLANCSHELRTPLARIRLAVDRVPDTDPKVTAELARSIAELDALIGEMLLSSRLEVARGLERAELVDVLALAAEEAAHFDLEVSGDAVTIRADAMLLRRLVRNLLENARVHAGGATSLRVERDVGGARIVVEDAGAGVPAVDREKIFEPFFRSSHATQSSGAGLGLAIVSQIARAHGGTVAYTPREAGGSCFIVSLPGG